MKPPVCTSVHGILERKLRRTVKHQRPGLLKVMETPQGGCVDSTDAKEERKSICGTAGIGNFYIASFISSESLLIQQVSKSIQSDSRLHEVQTT